MKKKSNIKKNFIWNLIGLSFYSFSSLFLLIIVTRINGMDEAGVFTYAFSLSTLFFYIALYFNRVYQISNYNSNKSFNQYLSTRLLMSIVSFVLILIFSLISRFDTFKIIIILILMMYRIIDSISDTFYGYVQEKEKLYKSGISYSIKAILGILLFIIVDIISNNLILSCITFLAVNIIVFFIYDYNCYKVEEKKNNIKFDLSNTKLILLESLPIFLFSFLNIYLANTQKYVLTYYVSNSLQTIFGILIMPATVISLIGSYLIMPFVTRFKEYKNNNDIKSFISSTIKINLTLVVVGIFVIIIGYLIGIPVLNIIYGVDLGDYLIEFIVILVGAIFNGLCMITSNILTIAGSNKAQLIPYGISSIMSTVLSIIMIKTNGLSGACYVYLITAIINFVVFVIVYIYSINKISQSGGLNEKRK